MALYTVAEWTLSKRDFISRLGFLVIGEFNRRIHLFSDCAAIFEAISEIK